MKADIDIVKLILQRNELDVRTISGIMQDIESAVKEDAQETRPPPIKKQFVVLVSDPKGNLPKEDFVAWVLQIPQDDNIQVTQEKLIQSAYDFNASPKGKTLPVRTIGEACESVSAKFMKEHNLWLKTKEPVLVLRTSNVIPTEES